MGIRAETMKKSKPEKVPFYMDVSSHVETVVCLDKKKPKDYVEIGVDAEDYYRIKDSGNER